VLGPIIWESCGIEDCYFQHLYHSICKYCTKGSVSTPRMLVVAGDSLKVRFLDDESKDPICLGDHATIGRTGPIAVSPDGTKLAVSYMSAPNISMWDLVSMSQLGDLEAAPVYRPGIGAHTIRFSADGKRVLAIADNQLCSWDVVSLDRPFRLLYSHRIVRSTLIISPQADLFALTNKTSVRFDLYDGSTGLFLDEYFPVIRCGSEGFVLCCFSACSQMMALCNGSAGIVSFWHVRDHCSLGTREFLTVKPRFLRLLEFCHSSHGSQLIALFRNHELNGYSVVFDVSSAAVLRVIALSSSDGGPLFQWRQRFWTDRGLVLVNCHHVDKASTGDRRQLIDLLSVDMKSGYVIHAWSLSEPQDSFSTALYLPQLTILM
jgi:hypothetical protein